MIKRTLIAIAVVALLATSAHAALTEFYLPMGPVGDDVKTTAVKVDGKETVDFRWPYTINYKALKLCTVPIYMQVGMYVQVENCKDLKIVLVQRDCGDLDIGKGAADFPCYYGCVTFRVRANFPVKMGQELARVGDIIPADDKWSCAYVGDGGDTVPDDGNYKDLKICVKAWGVSLWKSKPGDEVKVGELKITVKPNV